MKNNEHKRWTEEDKNYVYDVWGINTIKSIAKKLGRTELAIIRFAEKNGLGGCMLNDYYLSTTQASEIIGVDPTTIITWIKTNQLKGKTKSLKRRRFYLIDPKDFKQFLIDNPKKWKVKNYKENVFKFDQRWLDNKSLLESCIPKSNNLWTTKEEALLIQRIKEGRTSREIALELGRSLRSIRHKRLRVECA